MDSFPELNVVVHEFRITGSVEAKYCDIGTVTEALGVLTMKNTRKLVVIASSNLKPLFWI